MKTRKMGAQAKKIATLGSLLALLVGMIMALCYYKTGIDFIGGTMLVFVFIVVYHLVVPKQWKKKFEEFVWEE